MLQATQEQPEIVSCFLRWAEAMADLKADEQKIEFIRYHLSILLNDKAAFRDILTCISKGDNYPNIHKAMMFDNEVLLYQAPGRLFSVRIFLWDHGEFTPVHDHNSWGVIGPVFGNLEVVKYEREDDRSVNDYACLKEISRSVLRPGQTDYTFPLNEGIHKTGNCDQNVTVSVSVYGTPLRRPFIQGFDLSQGRIFTIYAPKTKKKLLASRALDQY